MKGRGVSGRLTEFHFAVNIAINYQPKSIFDGMKLKTKNYKLLSLQ